MNSDAPSYGLWSLVVINSMVFIIFAFSFAQPRTSRDWPSFGAFSAFLVALFTEMYGPIYLLSAWLVSRFPASTSRRTTQVPSARDTAGSAGQSAFRSVSPRQRRAHQRRGLAAGGRVAGALPCAA